MTASEMESWRDRIAHRIDRRIAAIAAEEPNFLQRIQQEARDRSLRSLGIADLQNELDQVERNIQSQQVREQELERERLARIRGVSVDRLLDYTPYQHEPEISAAIEQRQEFHEQELLAESEIGRRILQLRLERDNLLDTIALATAPASIKELWTRIGQWLADQPTTLQQIAIAIASDRE